MISEIRIERRLLHPGGFHVVMPDEDSEYGEYVSAHFKHSTAMTEALKLAREYAPARIIDRSGGADGHP